MMTSATSAAASADGRACLAIAAVLFAMVSGCGRLAFDPGAAPDATIPDAALVDARPCSGTAHTAIDNFDDNVRDAALWGNAFMDAVSTHGEADGRLVIDVGANAAGDWAGYVTTSAYELADDRAFVEVLQLSAPGTNTILLLSPNLAETDGPSIESENGMLIFRLRINDTINDRASIAYDPAAHRWWQIRERAGRTYWELSRDGVNWTIGHDEPTSTPTMVFITLAAGAGLTTGTPGSAMFDNFNGGGAPPACP